MQQNLPRKKITNRSCKNYTPYSEVLAFRRQN
jgi:hypothetical protein